MTSLTHTSPIDPETFTILHEVNESINCLLDHAEVSELWSEPQMTDAFEKILSSYSYSLDEWAEAIEYYDSGSPQRLYESASELYRVEIEGYTPFNAAELVIGFLLEKGLSSPDAHSFLCTIQTLYDLNLKAINND